MGQGSDGELYTTHGMDPESFRRWAEGDRHAVLDENEMAFGIEQHPTTRQWQLWNSTNGFDVNWVGAWNRKGDAEQALQAWRVALEGGQLHTDAGVTALLEAQERAGAMKGLPMPEKIVHRLLKRVAARSAGVTIIRWERAS
jgi:hypothetical protein